MLRDRPSSPIQGDPLPYYPTLDKLGAKVAEPDALDINGFEETDFLMPHQFIERHLPLLKSLSQRPRLRKAISLFDFQDGKPCAGSAAATPGAAGYDPA